MHNKTSLIVEALVTELRKNSSKFGNIVAAGTNGFNFSTADIASNIDGNTEIYRVIVIKSVN